jgi:hypothetical protein
MMIRNRFMRRLAFLALDLLILLEAVLIAFLSVSPCICLFWSLKEILGFSSPMSFTKLWLTSMGITSLILTVNISIKARRIK